jgi:hypothetical protein
MRYAFRSRCVFLSPDIADGIVKTHIVIEDSKYSFHSGATVRSGIFVVFPDLKDRIVEADIHEQIMGSDHCPVSLILSL